MSISSLGSPAVVDGIVPDEKFSEPLALQAEYPDLDYKSTTQLSATGGAAELPKDTEQRKYVGGYTILGMDGPGALTGMAIGSF